MQPEVRLFMTNVNASMLFSGLVLILCVSSRCLCNFRSDPGLIILTIQKDAIIDVEKMKEEKLLPKDGKNNFTFLIFSLHLIYNFI